jgi:hypothetical protein
MKMFAASPVKMAALVNMPENWRRSSAPSPIFGCLLSNSSIKSHVGLPDLPDLADEIGSGFQGHLPRAPSGGSGFRSFAVPDKLEGPDLAEGLVDISAHRWGQDLKPLNYAVGINYEPGPCFHVHLFAVNPEGCSYLAALIQP